MAGPSEEQLRAEGHSQHMRVSCSAWLTRGQAARRSHGHLRCACGGRAAGCALAALSVAEGCPSLAAFRVKGPGFRV